MIVAFTHDCENDECDGEAETSVMFLNQEEDLRIPLWQLSQLNLVCRECGTEYGTGDIEIENMENV